MPTDRVLRWKWSDLETVFQRHEDPGWDFF
jgi:hypothetical protein